MKRKSILAALLLLLAGLQTAMAQKVLLYKSNSQVVEYEVSELDSIVFVEAEAKLVQQIVLSVTSLSLQPNDMRFLTATVLPENAQNKVVTWQSSDTNVAEVNQSGRVIANANGTCVITCRATDGSGVKATCQVTVGSSGQEDDQGYVEIGGLKWATMNVGATTVAGSYETCYGDYFAWGETQPRYATITHYPTITVKGVEASFTWKSGYSSGYSESNYPSYTGSTLDAAHDAATANWGSTWRTPTKADYESLAAACSGSSANSQKPVVLNSTITKGGIYWLSSTQTIESAYTGVAGLLFVSASDISKRVFFPASGYIFDTSLNYSGANPYDKDGFYWSSTLYTSDTSSAYALDFSSPGITPSSGYYRCYGFTVRPVCNGSGAAALVTIITISPSTLSLEVGKTQTLTATVLPSNANNKAVAWTSSNTSVATVSTSGMVTAKAVGTCTITCSATDGSGVKATCQVTVTSGTTPAPGSHEFVDLGLPSGTLWATCNVGANSPEEYGDYFAWGETKPKSIYNWSTYFDIYDGGRTFNKYYNNGGLTELQPEDDAATANWGSGWNMPSYDQIKELCNSSYTTIEWTQVNGVNGRKVTSKSNGNSIFLPAAGYRWHDDLSVAGSFGYYWSSSLYPGNDYSAYCFNFGSVNWNWGYDDRCYGRSVRAVRVP